MACEAYPIIEEGDVMNVVLLEPEKHENLYYVETIGQFDADMFRRLVCAFMNSTDDGYIWLGLDERARCRGIVLNRGYRDKIRREFCNTTFDCGYRPPYGDLETFPVSRGGQKVMNLFVLKIFLPKIVLSINKEKMAFKLNGNYWKRDPNGKIYMINRAKANVCLM